MLPPIDLGRQAETFLARPSKVRFYWLLRLIEAVIAVNIGTIID